MSGNPWLVIVASSRHSLALRLARSASIYFSHKERYQKKFFVTDEPKANVIS